MASTAIDRPVQNLPMVFEWQTGTWFDLFEKHVEFIQQDVLRHLAADRMVVYLSCPISKRGGSVAMTNVEVADATARRLTGVWGERFWFLNPGQYQLESKHGTGLIRRHAKILELEKNQKVDIDDLIKNSPPRGGDYMRMWTRVLAEDGGTNLGERFSAYYFMGPSDLRHFFTMEGRMSLSAGVEEYFARKFAVDADFQAYFSEPFRDDQGTLVADQKAEWGLRRKEFLRYYTVRASAGFSRGSHDEWNIWVNLNKLRFHNPQLGVGLQIPGYFDGQQVDPGAGETLTIQGYATGSPSPGPASGDAPSSGSSARPQAPTEATSHEKAIESLVHQGEKKS